MSKLSWVLSLSLLAAAPIRGALLNVTSTADSGPGTLRDQIAAANPSGDEIRFQLALPATITVASPLVIDKSLTLTGPGADLLTLSGGGATRVLYISEEDVPLTVAISGLTVANGRHDPGTDVGSGGGILNQRADLTITACAIVDNVVVGGVFNGNGLGAAGGGIWTNRGTVVVRDTTVARNRVEGGQGIAFATGGYASGGGIYTTGDGAGLGDVTLVNVTVTDNVAEGADGFPLGPAQGGGIFTESSSIALEHCTIADNSAVDGELTEPPGISATTPNAVESALAPAGGVAVLSGSLELSRSLVVGNQSNGAPEDLLVEVGLFSSTGYSIVGTDPLVVGDPTDDFGNGTDPQLGPLSDNGGPTETRAIDAASAAFDRIPSGACTQPADQRGIPRPQGLGCDSGAYELLVAPPPQVIPALGPVGLAVLALLLATLTLAALHRRAPSGQRPRTRD